MFAALAVVGVLVLTFGSGALRERFKGPMSDEEFKRASES